MPGGDGDELAIVAYSPPITTGSYEKILVGANFRALEKQIQHLVRQALQAAPWNQP